MLGESNKEEGIGKKGGKSKCKDERNHEKESC